MPQNPLRPLGGEGRVRWVFEQMRSRPLPHTSPSHRFAPGPSLSPERRGAEDSFSKDARPLRHKTLSALWGERAG
jgi:hypothetical protein